MLAGPIPEETHATCEQCAMCPQPGDSPSGSPLFFNSRTKCCTYMPRLPNFLVGRLLIDDDPDPDPDATKGRATIEVRIEKGVAVTPLGLYPDPVHSLLYQRSPNAFGQSLALRCPHYIEESGHCGVWRHRESTCATWFCKFVRGAVGMRFWQVVRQLLHAVEESLAQWCVQELDMGTAALQLLFPPPKHPSTKSFDGNQLDGVADRQRYTAIWGNWTGREREFFKASASLVNPLTWDDVRAICGPEIQIFELLTQEAYSSLLSTDLPPVLQVHSFKAAYTGPGYSYISAYNSFDTLKLPKTLLDVLHYFDGRPTGEVLRSIEAEKNLKLSQSLLRKLVDFGILSAVGEG